MRAWTRLIPRGGTPARLFGLPVRNFPRPFGKQTSRWTTSVSRPTMSWAHAAMCRFARQANRPSRSNIQVAATVLTLSGSTWWTAQARCLQVTIIAASPAGRRATTSIRSTFRRRALMCCAISWQARSAAISAATAQSPSVRKSRCRLSSTT